MKRRDDASRAREAVERALAEADAVIGAMMALAADRTSKESVGQGIEKYIAIHGEPHFRVECYRCGGTVFEAPLVYPAARGNWSWFPPAYLAARFYAGDGDRRCPACGAPFPSPEP